jgi:hypothetical protein
MMQLTFEAFAAAAKVRGLDEVLERRWHPLRPFATGCFREGRQISPRWSAQSLTQPQA